MNLSAMVTELAAQIAELESTNQKLLAENTLLKAAVDSREIKIMAIDLETDEMRPHEIRNLQALFCITMTEYERGWGSKPDGVLAFASAEAASAYIKMETAGRNSRDVPDCYVSYEDIGLQQCGPQSAAKLAIAQTRIHDDGETRPWIYVDHKRDLLV